jgi:crotonobetainyl-CoA:carnitine CoA-transferase CaiB-like acyl-CoA transferase
MANRDALEHVMNAVLTTRTTEHWVEVLEAAGVPCGPVYDYAQRFADPQSATAASFNKRGRTEPHICEPAGGCIDPTVPDIRSMTPRAECRRSLF